MERKQVLYDNAERFARRYYELAKDGKVEGLTPYDRELLKGGESKFVDYYSEAFRTNLANRPEYSEDSWDDMKAERLNKTKDDDGIGFALYGGKSPEQKHEEAEFNKFKELVEDGKWYGMEPGAISLWANRNGYDWSSKGERDKFWDDLSKFDIIYNRGRIAQEFASSGGGKVAALLAPNAYEEVMYQNATGDYDDSRLKGQVAVDAAADLATWLAPSLGNVAKWELAAPVIGGAAQAASEGARQGAKWLINDNLEPEAGAPVTAFTLGSSIPMGATFLRSFAANTPSQSGRAFARGMAKGTRGVMDAEEVEKNQIKADLLMARTGIKRRIDADREATFDMFAGGPGNTPPSPGSLNQVLRENQATDRVLKQLRLLGTEGFENSTGGAVKYGDPIARSLQGFKDARAARGKKTPQGILPIEQGVDDAGNQFEGIMVTASDALKPELYQRGLLSYDPILLSKVSKSAKLTGAEQKAVDKFQKRVGGIVEGLKGQDMGDIQLGVTHNAETGKPLVGWIDNGSPDWGYNAMSEMTAEELGLLRSASVKMRTARGMDAVDVAYNSIGPVSNMDDPKMVQKALEMQAAFPEKMAALGMDEHKRAYNLGRAVGGAASYTFGRLEPMTQVTTTSMFGEGIKAKTERFKQSEYFQNLPEEKKNALEAAFKKMQEEQKQKKLDVQFSKQRVSRKVR